MKIRTLIVDDEPLARDRLRGFLKAEPAVEVIGECGSGPEAVGAITSAWGNPADSERNIRWTKEFYAAMEPHLADAIYANYTYLSDESKQRHHEVYGRHAERLAQLKATYDPTNLFRLNHNVQPAAG